MFAALEVHFLDIYKRLDYAGTLSKVLKKNLSIPKELDPYNTDFARSYLYMQTMLAHDKALDYLGQDFGEGDILKFDDKTFSKIIQLNKIIREFFAVCAKELATGEVDFS